MITMTPRFPQVVVKLSGEDGNPFGIIGRVRRAMRKAGATPEEIEAFTNDAQAGDYQHVLQTAMDWVEVE